MDGLSNLFRPELWWVFPAAATFSTIAISSGVSSALFFSPFFMLVVGLSPAQAVGAGLFTQIFGMGNGLRSYVGQRLVDYGWARAILLASVPGVALGALLAHWLPDGTLKLVFGSGLLGLAGLFFLSSYAREALSDSAEDRSAGRVLTAKDGRRYWIPSCTRGPGVALAGLGGFLTGVISAGLPELNTAQMVLRCKIPPRVAVATSVFSLAITTTIGATIHAFAASTAWHVLVWSIPGVLVGSTIGSRIGKYFPPKAMKRGLALIFCAVGVLVLWIELTTG